MVEVLNKIWAFINENLAVCIAVAAVLVAVIVVLIVVFAIKRRKKRKAEEYDRIIKNAPEVDIDDDGKGFNKDAFDGRPADFAWLRGETAKTEVIKADEIKIDENKSGVENAAGDKKTSQKKNVGKWIIKEKGQSEFVSFLYANNGELLLSSEIYSSAEGAKKGIATIRKNAVQEGNFQIYCDKNGHYYYKLKTSNNRILCVGESYPTKNSCLGAVDSVKRFVDAPILDEVEKDITAISYIPTEGSVISHKSGYSGKWKINKIDDMYIASLYASNGEMLLSSESYQSYSSAKTAIGGIRNNGLEGNFIIDCDKNGRYYFKLRNAQKSTLCVSETYAQLASCQSAIDSVRRFLRTAKISDGIEG